MNKLRLAVQKSGRLQEGTMELLKRCGIHAGGGNGKLLAPVDSFPMEILFLRDDDIPQYVQDGVAHIGIAGENVFVESEKRVELHTRLGFSRCRLALAVPKNTDIQSIEWFNGKDIATSYPVILKKFLEKNNLSARVHEISGSVEIAPGIGLAHAVCDVVSTGSTLLMNGLKEAHTVFESEAVLLASPGLNTELRELVNKLVFRIKSVILAQRNKYVLLNAPNEKLEEITKILPGMKSPTVLPLARAGWSSVHSVISEHDFWNVIDRLKDAGAQGILIVPIEKMVV